VSGPQGTLPWSEAADRTLRTLTDMVPETVRELAEVAVRDESESIAAAREADEVSSDDVIRGWIRTTPPDQRDGLVAVIDDLGFDVDTYADALQSDEGWTEAEDAGM